MGADIGRRVASEAIGSALLLATVVGSGIMGTRLSGGNVALALLANSLATGAILVVLITMFGAVSGAHFNPLVSIVMWWRGELARQVLLAYFLAQLVGAIMGTWVAHLMFDLPIIQLSTTQRTGIGQWAGEAVATFGFLLAIIGCGRQTPQTVASVVGMYIVGAYWFTSSTSFANPAVTVARSLTASFAGISPLSVAPFIAAQVLGALAATLAAAALWPARHRAQFERRE